MHDDLFVEARGDPVALSYGPVTGKHVIATIRAIGSMGFRTVREDLADRDGERPFMVSRHELVYEDWQQHPDEAPAVYELREGDKALATYAFPSLSDSVDPAKEEQIAAHWDAVRQFVDENHIKLGSVAGDFRSACLESCLEGMFRPGVAHGRPLNTPAAEPAHELSA
jgi:hypothetical protein